MTEKPKKTYDLDDSVSIQATPAQALDWYYGLNVSPVPMIRKISVRGTTVTTWLEPRKKVLIRKKKKEYGIRKGKNRKTD